MIEHVVEGCQCKGKKCPACNAVLCIGAFGKKGSGIRSRCKPCHALYQREWNNAHPGYNAAQCQGYYDEHAEQLREDARIRTAQRDPELERIRLREYYRAHPEKSRAHHANYYQQNTEKVNTRIKANRKAHPERYTPKAVIRHENRRTRKTQAGGSYTVAEWQALKAQYDYTCLCCGKQEPEIKLTADHVIPVIKLGTSNIDNIQPLCLPCNVRKHDKIIDYRRCTSGQYSIRESN